jgi:conjugal transfer pilus assembly protein TraU
VRRISLVAVLVLLLGLLTPAGRSFAGSEKCDFFNPITDVCWTCLFPIRLGGIPITPSFGNQDYSSVSSPICVCMTPFPRIGLTLSLWEPVRIAETTKRPWLFPDFCLDLGISKTPAGSSTSNAANNQRKQSWQVHWFIYPIFEMLSIGLDFACLEHPGGMDIAYVSELDPAWNDDFTALFIYPETILLANPLTEFACLPDRALTSVKEFGLDALFWCAGNWGTTYPFTKQTYQDNPTVGSALAVAKINAMLHRNLVALKTVGKGALCGATPSFTFPKKQYKYQLAKPIRGGRCVPVGEDGIHWATLKEPYTNDTYHSFVVWRKRDCCAF